MSVPVPTPYADADLRRVLAPPTDRGPHSVWPERVAGRRPTISSDELNAALRSYDDAANAVRVALRPIDTI